MEGTAITFALDSWQALSLAIGTLLPVLVGLVTKRVTSANIKSVLLVFLSTLSGLGTELLTAHNQNVDYDLGRGTVTALATFITGVSLHYGFWKPTGVAHAAQDLGASKAEVDPALSDIRPDSGSAEKDLVVVDDYHSPAAQNVGKDYEDVDGPEAEEVKPRRPRAPRKVRPVETDDDGSLQDEVVRSRTAEDPYNDGGSVFKLPKI